jgi:hypothetical protein
MSLTLSPAYLDHFYLKTPPNSSSGGGSWADVESRAAGCPGFTRFTSPDLHVRTFSSTAILYKVSRRWPLASRHCLCVTTQVQCKRVASCSPSVGGNSTCLIYARQLVQAANSKCLVLLTLHPVRGEQSRALREPHRQKFSWLYHTATGSGQHVRGDWSPELTGPGARADHCGCMRSGDLANGEDGSWPKSFVIQPVASTCMATRAQTCQFRARASTD